MTFRCSRGRVLEFDLAAVGGTDAERDELPGPTRVPDGFDVVAISFSSLEREDAPALRARPRRCPLASSRWACSAAAARSGSCAEQAASSSRSSSSWRSCSCAARRQQHRPVALAAVPGGPDRAHAASSTRRLVDREVEGGVLTHRRACVAGLRGPRRARPAARGRGTRRARSSNSSAAPSHCHRLEREPDREQLAQLLDVEPHHLRAVMRDVLRETQRLELADGFADRRDAHPERAGEILEPQRRARRQLAEDDRLPQPLERGFGHGAVADGTRPAVGGDVLTTLACDHT